MVNTRGSKVQSDSVDASCAVEVGEHLLERKVPGRRNRDPLSDNYYNHRHAPLRTNCLLEGCRARPLPSSALLKSNFDKARNAAAISHCPTIPEDSVLKTDSKDVKVSQRLRRWAVLYQFKICGCPPVEEWRGRDGMLSHICNALAIGKENRRHIEKYLLNIVDLDFDKIDPSAGFKHSRPAQIKEDSEEAQLICRALETGGLILSHPRIVTQHPPLRPS